MNASPRPISVLLNAMAACVLLLAPVSSAQLILDDVPEEAQGVDVEEKLGNTIPLDLVVTNSDGESVPLSVYFRDGKPAILLMAYYRCPIVCPLIMERLADAMDELDYTVGEDFNAIVVSFDPTETATVAKDAELAAHLSYDRGATDEVKAGWRYHVTTDDNAKLLARSIGYRYKLLPNGEYSHPVAFVVLSPEGSITRYIYGFDYPKRELKLSLLDASEGKIAKSFGDRLLHFCYRYDPDAGAHTLQAVRVMQVGAAITMVLLGGLVGTLLIAERYRRRAGSGKRPGGSNSPGVRVHAATGHTP